jgi:hypothetical protein
MQRAPLPGVGSMAVPTDPPAPSLLPIAVTGPGLPARGFSGVHLLALFLAETGVVLRRITSGVGPYRSG